MSVRLFANSQIPTLVFRLSHDGSIFVHLGCSRVICRFTFEHSEIMAVSNISPLLYSSRRGQVDLIPGGVSG